MFPIAEGEGKAKTLGILFIISPSLLSMIYYR